MRGSIGIPGRHGPTGESMVCRSKKRPSASPTPSRWCSRTRSTPTDRFSSAGPGPAGSSSLSTSKWPKERSFALSAREKLRGSNGASMKKATSRSRRRQEPTAASLRALPQIDFSSYRVRRNPYADRIVRDGIRVVHDEPSRESLAAMPEPDFSSVRARRNPYASRAAEALARMQVGQGRPRRGHESGPTPTRSIRLPRSVWDALEEEARLTNTTVHALLRKAVTAYLLR